MKKKLSNKLSLKKETLTSLTKSQMNILKGGAETDTAFCSDGGFCSDQCPTLRPSANTICNCE